MCISAYLFTVALIVESLSFPKKYLNNFYLRAPLLSHTWPYKPIIIPIIQLYVLDDLFYESNCCDRFKPSYDKSIFIY